MRKNPSTTTWILILAGVGVGGYLVYRWAKVALPQMAGKGIAAFLTGGPSAPSAPKPPPLPSQSEAAARERAYRYRMIGGGRCFDYKARKVVPKSYCE